MRLPGKLGPATLGDALGVSFRARVNGVLELIEGRLCGPDRAHRIHLISGLVQEVESPLGAPKIGEFLRRDGWIGPSALYELERLLRSCPGRRAAHLLVEARHVSKLQVAVALRKQSKERLEALFDLRQAELRFRVAHLAPDAVRALPLLPADFLHGRPRGRDALAANNGTEAERDLHWSSELEPGREADQDSVRRALRRRLASAHPDRYPSAAPSERAAIERRFADLSAAYRAFIGS